MLGAAFCALAYYFFRVQVVLNHLRDHHAETYRDMGSPHIIMNNGFRTGAAARRFIGAKDHDYFGDTELRRKVAHARTSQHLAYVVFVCYGAVWCWLAFTHPGTVSKPQ